eukprot:scaffold6861_cov120-Isochrysis_galbana.AAC.2
MALPTQNANMMVDADTVFGPSSPQFSPTFHPSTGCRCPPPPPRASRLRLTSRASQHSRRDDDAGKARRSFRRAKIGLTPREPARPRRTSAVRDGLAFTFTYCGADASRGTDTTQWNGRSVCPDPVDARGACASRVAARGRGRCRGQTTPFLRRTIGTARADESRGDKIFAVVRELGHQRLLAERDGDVLEPGEKAPLSPGAEAAGLER